MILIFAGSGIIVTLLQGILYFIVRTFSKTLYRKINYYICYAHYSLIIFTAEWYSGSETYIYVDKNDMKNFLGKEHAFLIVNHSTDIDWLFTGLVSDKVDCVGNFKAYIKKEIQYLPVIGWSIQMSENVFLSRTFHKDKEIISKQISELFDQPNPMWLLLFPEGTRYTPNKHEVSVKYARERGLPEFKHHLTPRVNGFLTSLPAMRGKMGAIYDITLVFKPNAQIKPAVTSLLFGRKLECHMYIKRIPFGTVPEDEKEASKFLYAMFEKKDKLKDSFINTGDFFATSGVKREDPVKLKPSYSVFLCTMCW
ncbi:1-Acylglycerol-3-phosphate O-acyltransferase 4 [Carabus blaptoides fortunei]